jgi:ABC-type sugar transport system substrate-binding protein
VNWIYSGYDPQEVFIIPALEQAGLDEQVQISSVLGEAPNLEFIRKGQVQASDVAWDQHYTGWAMIDQVLRQLAGQPLAEPANENVPEQLLTKENLPEASSEAYTATEVPYEEEYLKLWGVSK